MTRFRVIKEIRSVSHILPAIMVLCTGKARHLPEIKWSADSWVHNIFRVYEMIFWRRYGIRLEIVCDSFGNRKAYTFEGSCALLEADIRELFRIYIPKKIWIPVMITPMGIPIPISPYLFAVAYDTTASFSNTGTTHNWNHTITGSNPFIHIGTYVGAGDGWSTHTYDGTTLTVGTFDIDSITEDVYMLAPPTGTKQAAFATVASRDFVGVSSSFSGTNQTTIGAKGASRSPVGDTAPTFTLTTLAANSYGICWFFGGNNGNIPAVNNCTSVYGVRSFNFNLCAGYVSWPTAGSNSLTWTSTNNQWGGVQMEIEAAPVAASASGVPNLLLMSVG